MQRESTKTKKQLTEIRTVYPFITFWNLANKAIQRASKDVNPTDEYLLGALCLAFCIEGYLNQIGKRRFEKSWEEFEHKSPEEKLVSLCNISNYQPNFGNKPFQTFKEIFKFRNTLVHSKTEVRKKGSTQLFENEITPEFALPLTEWEKMLNPKKAKQLLDDTEKIIKTVHSKANFVDDPFKIPPWESTIYQYDSRHL